MEAKVANVETFGVVFLWHWRKVPDFEVVLSELDRLDCFNLRLFNKVLNLTLIHAIVFIVLKVRSLLLFALVDYVLLAIDLAWVDLDEVLRHPSVEAPIEPNVVHVVLIPQTVAKVGNKFGSAVLG